MSLTKTQAVPAKLNRGVYKEFVKDIELQIDFESGEQNSTFAEGCLALSHRSGRNPSSTEVDS